MSEISKCEYRAVIKFLTLEKRSANNIYERLTNVYGDSAPSYATVTRWVAEFKRGRTSLEDDPRAGRPVEATTDDCCHAVEMLVMGDRRLKVLEIAREVGISYGSVLNMLHDHLGLSSLCKIGSTFADACSEVISGGNVFRTVGYLQCQLRQRFVPHCNWRRKCGFTTGILSPNRSQCSESTPTHRHPGSFALSRRLEVMATIC